MISRDSKNVTVASVAKVREDKSLLSPEELAEREAEEKESAEVISEEEVSVEEE